VDWLLAEAMKRVGDDPPEAGVARRSRIDSRTSLER